MELIKQQTLPSGSWVRVKDQYKGREDGDLPLRFITGVLDSHNFYDDGKISGKPPSPRCRFRNYELFIAI